MTEELNPPFTITFECGCTVEYKDTLKIKPYASYPENNKRLYCPNHPEVFKKKKVILTCEKCGKIVTKSRNGTPLRCIVTARYCDECGRKIKLQLAKENRRNGTCKYQYDRHKEQQRKLKFEKRYEDCINYSDCLTKAAINNDMALNCKECSKYQKTVLNIADYDFCRNNCESLYNKLPVNFKQELNQSMKKIKAPNKSWGDFNEDRKRAYKSRDKLCA